MTKTLRNKLIELNGKKVRLTLTYGVVEDILLVNYRTQQNPNGRKNDELMVHCGQYGRTLKSILDVEEI